MTVASLLPLPPLQRRAWDQCWDVSLLPFHTGDNKGCVSPTWVSSATRSWRGTGSRQGTCFLGSSSKPSPLTLPSAMFSVFKDSCDEIGPIPLIQNYLSILRFLAWITSAKIPFYYIRPHIHRCWRLGCDHLWGPLLCLWQRTAFP